METRNPSLGTNKKLPNFRYFLALAASVNPGAGYFRLATLARAKWAQVGGKRKFKNTNYKFTNAL